MTEPRGLQVNYEDVEQADQRADDESIVKRTPGERSVRLSVR